MTRSIPLEFVTVEPDQADDAPRGLVLLHGRGADERDLLSLAEAMGSDRTVVSFRAPMALGEGYTWYDLDLSGGGLHASQPDAEDFEESLGALAGSVEIAIERFGLDADRVGFLGFSQGAVLAMSLMIEHPALPAWIVGLHGYLPERYDVTAIASVGDTPVFLAGGREDDIIPERRVRDAAERLAEGGVDVTYETYPVGHGVTPAELEDVESWLGSATERP